MAKPTLAQLAEQLARISRAREQEYDLDNPIYHGTSAQNIEAFDEQLIGSATDEGHYGRGIYFANSPGEARYYGPNVGKYYKRGKYLDLTNNSGDLTFLGHFKDFAPKLDAIGALSDTQKQALRSYQRADEYIKENVRFIKTQDGDKEGIGAQLKVDGPTGELSAFRNNRGLFATEEEALENIKFQFYRHLERNEREKYPGIGDEAASLSDYVRTELGSGNLTNAAKAAGYDGIVYGDETVVFDPKNIRSVDAEFDPKKTDSPNLLASPAGATIGAGVVGATATLSDRAYAEEIPNLAAVERRAQAFANQRDTKNKAWSNLKDAVGKMTQPFQPLAEFVAHSAAGMASGAGAAIAYDSTQIPAETIERGREAVRAFPEQIGFGPIDENAYQIALNRAIEGIAETVANDNVMAAFVDPVMQDIGPVLLDQYQQLDPRTQGFLSGVEEYLGNVIR